MKADNTDAIEYKDIKFEDDRGVAEDMKKKEDEMYFLPAGHGLVFAFNLGDFKMSRNKMEIYSHDQIHTDLQNVRLFL